METKEDENIEYLKDVKVRRYLCSASLGLKDVALQLQWANEGTSALPVRHAERP